MSEKNPKVQDHLARLINGPTRMQELLEEKKMEEKTNCGCDFAPVEEEKNVVEKKDMLQDVSGLTANDINRWASLNNAAIIIFDAETIGDVLNEHIDNSVASEMVGDPDFYEDIRADAFESELAELYERHSTIKCRDCGEVDWKFEVISTGHINVDPDGSADEPTYDEVEIRKLVCNSCHAYYDEYEFSGHKRDQYRDMKRAAERRLF